MVNMSLVHQSRTEQTAGQLTSALAHSWAVLHPWAVSDTVLGSVHAWAEDCPALVFGQCTRWCLTWEVDCGLGSFQAPFESKGNLLREHAKCATIQFSVLTLFSL